jgi:acyl-CoA hydrolase
METIDLARLDLARYVRPGDGIIFGQGTGEPLHLTETLVERRSACHGASIFFGSAFSKTFAPEHADHLRFRGIGGIGSLRKLASAGVLDPVPCHISSIAPLIRRGDIASDVVLLLVSPPNERGEYSLGLVNDYVRTAIDRDSKLDVRIGERRHELRLDKQEGWVELSLPLDGVSGRSDIVIVPVKGEWVSYHAWIVAR